MTIVIIEGVVLKISYPSESQTLLQIDCNGEKNNLVVSGKKDLQIGDNIMSQGTLQTRTVKGTNDRVTAILAEKIYKQV